MNTLLLFIYYSIIVVLSTPSVEGKYQCDFKSVPLTCHQHTQAIGLSSIRPERRLLLTFDLSAVLGGGKYGILAPDFDYLAANHKMYVHAAMIASLLSVVIYHTMICQRRKAFAKRISTAVAAAIIAFYLAVPCIYFDSMYIKNPALRQTFALSIVIFIFRTLEAYFAYTPHGATKSLGMYVSYYIFPGEIIYDANTSMPVKARRKDIIYNFSRLLRVLVANSLLYSFMSHFDYTPFGRESRHYLHPKHLGNCFFVALYMQQTLEFIDAIASAMSSGISGIKAAKMMDSPLLKSQSIADFWGRRWNYLVHCVLKRGIYKPIRKYRSTTFASLGVFLASGLSHEFLNYTVELRNCMEVPIDSIYKPSNIRLGSNLAFFMWAFLVSSVERALGGFPSVGISPHAVPFFVLITSLPFAFWFVEPYFQGGFLWENEGIVFTIFRMD